MKMDRHKEQMKRNNEINEKHGHGNTMGGENAMRNHRNTCTDMI